MQSSSLSFLLYFLPALFLCYFLIPARFRGARNFVLLAISLFFCRTGLWGAVGVGLGLSYMRLVAGSFNPFICFQF